MNRGASHSKIFKDQDDYALFLKVLEEACSLFNVFISSYCLMGNHYHLLVNTPEGNLSRFMRHVNGVYTQRFNRKHKRDGALFRGRYRSIVIQADEYLTQIVKYIHNNPLKAKMVIKLEEYKWSSHLIYIKGKNLKSWLDVTSVLSLFSLKKNLAIANYKEFMSYPLQDEVSQFYSKKNKASILGENVFKEWIKSNFIRRDNKAQLEIKEKRELQGEKMLQIIRSKVCRMFKIDEKVLFEKKRGEENIPRYFAIALSRELSGLSLPELAEKFYISSYKTVATNHYRLKKKIDRSKKHSKLYKKLKHLCSHEEI